jgi:hypothetical protein
MHHTEENHRERMSPVSDCPLAMAMSFVSIIVSLIAIIITLSGCAVETTAVPVQIPCDHSFTYNHELHRIELRIKSEAPSVDICVAQVGREAEKHCWKTTKHYYSCISMQAADVPLMIEVTDGGDYCWEYLNQ